MRGNVSSFLYLQDRTQKEYSSRVTSDNPIQFPHHRLPQRGDSHLLQIAAPVF